MKEIGKGYRPGGPDTPEGPWWIEPGPCFPENWNIVDVIVWVIVVSIIYGLWRI